MTPTDLKTQRKGDDSAMTTWPKHPDGRPMKMGEMTRNQQREQIKVSCKRLQRELEHPVVQERLAAALRGENVNQ